MAPHGQRPAPEAETVRPGRFRVGLVAVALVVVVVGLVVARSGIVDPYRPGTSHRVVVPLNGCLRAGGLSLDGRTWSSNDRPPSGWPNDWSAPGSVPGTLDVVATDEGVFTADQGGTVRFHRLAPHAFSTLSCPIE